MFFYLIFIYFGLNDVAFFRPQFGFNPTADTTGLKKKKKSVGGSGRGVSRWKPLRVAAAALHMKHNPGGEEETLRSKQASREINLIHQR